MADKRAEELGIPDTESVVTPDMLRRRRPEAAPVPCGMRAVTTLDGARESGSR